MQINKIPAEEVGAKIVEWYSCIMSSSYEEAKLLKNEVELMLGNMENNDKMLAYYSLVEYRHNNMLDGNNRSVNLKDQYKFVETEVDHYLKYLYYFVSGQYEYNKQRYRTAIKLFRKAERLLEYVNDETEELEFFMYIGFIYYRINQYLFATSYLEQAENGFRRINYIRKSLNCKQVLGAIYSELREYDKAEQILKEALDKSTYPTSTGIILRVLGLNMFAQKRYNDAADYFKKSLEINEYSQSIFGMRSQTDLSHSLFKLGEYDLAISSFKKAKAGAEYYKEVEFNARCKFIEGLYIKNNTDIVDSAIRELNRASLFFEVCELSEELIEFYKEKDDNTNIIKYLNIAYEGKKNQSILGDDQV